MLNMKVLNELIVKKMLEITRTIPKQALDVPMDMLIEKNINEFKEEYTERTKEVEPVIDKDKKITIIKENE